MKTQEGAHVCDYGPAEHSRFGGSFRRACRVPGCRRFSLDIAEEEPEEEPETVCILRRWKPAHGGGLIACFPYPRAKRRPNADGACFEHIGQHGEYCARAMREKTRPVKGAELRAAPDVLRLLSELEKGYGYRLRFILRGL